MNVGKRDKVPRSGLACLAIDNALIKLTKMSDLPSTHFKGPAEHCLDLYNIGDKHAVTSTDRSPVLPSSSLT